MNERALRPGNLAAAALVIAGLLVAMQPERAPGTLRLLLLTVAAGAGLYALLVSVPPAWWTSPFEAGGPHEEAAGSDELDRIRASLGGRRCRLEHGPALPPEVVRALRPLIEVALERGGVDRRVEVDRDAGPPGRLSASSRAVLTADLRRRPPWFRMRRPDERAVAHAVHQILDEIER